MTGTVTAEAAALAAAVQTGEPDALIGFVREYPDSRLAPDALMLVAASEEGRLDDTAASQTNPNLKCHLQLEPMADGRAVLKWTVTGASALGIHPVGFNNAKLAAAGEKIIEVGRYTRITLVARDAAGTQITCWVAIGSNTHNSVPGGGNPSTLAPAGSGSGAVVASV